MSVHQRSDRGRGSPSPNAPMPARPFRVSEVDPDPGCREVRVEGELDLSVADQFQRRLDAAASDDVEVLIRLERCDFIDSTGIAAIVFAHRLLAEKGRRLLICGPSRQVSRILTVTGLDHDGLVYPSAEEALAVGFGHATEGPDKATEVHAAPQGVVGARTEA